jgi:hypothetical protein
METAPNLPKITNMINTFTENIVTGWHIQCKLQPSFAIFGSRCTGLNKNTMAFTGANAGTSLLFQTYLQGSIQNSFVFRQRKDGSQRIKFQNVCLSKTHTRQEKNGG